MSPRIPVAIVLGVLFAAPPAGAATWRWPVAGPVLERFAYASETPFARGQHRGIVIGGRAGAPVRAVCAGRVGFAGALLRRGAAVTVVCDALTASYLWLASVAVRRGDRVGVGDRLGRLGPRGLHLGARRTGRRWAYVDPLSLLAGEPVTRPVPPLAAPRGRIGPRPLGSPPRPAPFVLRWSAPVVAAARPAVPPVAWLGLGLLAAALPALGIGRVRRRRREAARRPYAPPDVA